MLQSKKDSCSYFAVLLAMLADMEFYSIRFVCPSIHLFSFVDNITNSFCNLISTLFHIYFIFSYINLFGTVLLVFI